MSDIIVWYAPEIVAVALLVLLVAAAVAVTKTARRLRRDNIASVEVLDD